MKNIFLASASLCITALATTSAQGAQTTSNSHSTKTTSPVANLQAIQAKLWEEEMNYRVEFPADVAKLQENFINIFKAALSQQYVTSFVVLKRYVQHENIAPSFVLAQIQEYAPKRELESNMVIAQNPALQAIASVRPYLIFHVYQKPKVFSMQEAHQYICNGFMVPYVQGTHKGMPCRIPIAYSLIQCIGDSKVSEISKKVAMGTLKWLLDSGLNVLRENPIEQKDTKFDLFGMVDLLDASEDIKNQLKEEFNKTLTNKTEEQKQDKKNMFYPGTRFNYAEHGKPYELADWQNNSRGVTSSSSLTGTSVNFSAQVKEIYRCEDCGSSFKGVRCENPSCC